MLGNLWFIGLMEQGQCKKSRVLEELKMSQDCLYIRKHKFKLSKEVIVQLLTAKYSHY